MDRSKKGVITRIGYNSPEYEYISRLLENGFYQKEDCADVSGAESSDQ